MLYLERFLAWVSALVLEGCLGNYQLRSRDGVLDVSHVTPPGHFGTENVLLSFDSLLNTVMNLINVSDTNYRQEFQEKRSLFLGNNLEAPVFKRSEMILQRSERY